MALSTTIYNLLLDQYKIELGNQYFYTGLGAWSKYNGYDAAAHFFYSEAHSEGKHAKWVRKFIEDRGEQFEMGLPAYADPAITDYASMFTMALQKELDTTAHVNLIYGAALQEKDFIICKCLKPLFSIQYDEEKEMTDIVSKIISRGGSPANPTAAISAFNAEPDAIHDFESWLCKKYN
jgi:ferritin